MADMDRTRLSDKAVIAKIRTFIPRDDSECAQDRELMPAPISHPVRTSAEDIEQRFFQAVRGYSFCVEKVRGFTVRLNYGRKSHPREQDTEANSVLMIRDRLWTCLEELSRQGYTNTLG